MRILHGMTDVAGQGSYAVLGLQQNNVDAEMVVWEKNKFAYIDYKSLNISRKPLLYPISFLKMSLFAIKAMREYDVFHFHFSRSLMPFNLDLKVLKRLDKKVYMEYHGSDIRWQHYRTYPKFWPTADLPPKNTGKLKAIDRVQKYVDAYIVHDFELEKHLPKNDVPVYYAPLKINVDRFTPIFPDRNKTEKIRIVHAPSENIIKGSKYVEEAINSLKSRYDIEYVLVQNKPQNEALEIFATADIIVDQLFIGSYGVFAIESMAMGKPVVCYLADDMVSQFPKELPIVNATINDLAEKLESLIIDAEKRYSLGVQGRNYAENYHDYKYVAKELEEIYVGNIAPTSQREAFEYVRNLREG